MFMNCVNTTKDRFDDGVALGAAMAAMASIDIISDMEPADLMPGIKRVIFQEPATVIFWDDNTKTVVKTQDGEPYDKEKGLAMAYIKKAFGNKSSYNDLFDICEDE